MTNQDFPPEGERKPETDNPDRVSNALSRQVVSGIGADLGGIKVTSMLEVMEMAKLMAVSGPAVPKDLRNNPGICLAVCLQALEWRMTPFAVANKSYVTNDRLNFESQLLHALIEARAPLKERLRVRYEGEGQELKCYVYGTLRGEAEPRMWPLEGQAKPLKDKHPGHVTKDGRKYVKGSPLWDTKPDLQMFYDASRDWARVYCPDVILGVYTPDELVQYAPGGAPGDGAQTVSGSEVVDTGEAQASSLHERLKAAQNGGPHLDEGAVDRGMKDEGEPPKGGKGKGKGKAAAKATTEPAQEAPKDAPKTEPASQQAAQPEPEAKQETAPAGKPVSTSEKEPEPPVAAKEPEPAKVPAREPEIIPPTKGGKEPTNPVEYRAWVEEWVRTAINDDEIEKRWARERKLRNTCGLTDVERAPIRTEVVDPRIKELQEVAK